MPATVDQIMTEVIAHRFAAADEMTVTLVKTAYSPNIKERRGCSVAIFDARGDLVALAAIAPTHLSSLFELVQNITRRHGLGSFGPGDAFLTNDPHVGGGSHLPDLTLAGPVFVDGRVVAFVANIAHHSDIGGKVAGSESADCMTIFQEGLRIPPSSCSPTSPWWGAMTGRGIATRPRRRPTIPRAPSRSAFPN